MEKIQKNKIQLDCKICSIMIILLIKGGLELCLIFNQKNHYQIQIIGQKQSKKETVTYQITNIRLLMEEFIL